MHVPFVPNKRFAACLQLTNKPNTSRMRLMKRVRMRLKYPVQSKCIRGEAAREELAVEQPSHDISI
jgi:hypothetical protein